MSLEVLNAPIYASIQGRGRFAYTHLGVTVSGAMDEYAYGIANQLLGNDADAHVIEVNFSGLTLLAYCDMPIAVTGARCELTISSQPVPQWQSLILRKGEILHIGKIWEGQRVYLAAQGGLSLLGGGDPYGESRLRQGDTLACRCHHRPTHNQRLRETLIPHYGSRLELRVIPSYQYHCFSSEQKDRFFSGPYTVTHAISRMGYKLEGAPIVGDIPGIISEPIAFGSIQIPPNGQPIVLLKDRQTIGGYPKIGVVLDVDCYRLAQAGPGAAVRFRPITHTEGVTISRRFQSIMMSAVEKKPE